MFGRGCVVMKLNRRTFFSALVSFFICLFLFSGYIKVFFPAGVGKYISLVFLVLSAVFIIIDINRSFLSGLIIIFIVLALFTFAQIFSHQLNANFYFSGYSNKNSKLFLLISAFLYSGFCASYLHSRQNLLYVFVGIFASMAFILSVAILLKFGSAGGNERLGAEGGGNPIWIARLSGFSALFFMTYLGDKSQKNRHLFALVGLLIAFLVMLRSGSRGPIVALVLSFVIWNTSKVKLLSFDMIKGAFKYLVLIIIGALMAPPIFLQRMASMFTGTLDGSALIRFELLYNGITLFLEEPFGRGLGSFANYSDIPYPHNFFVEIAAELGILVLLTTVFFMGYIFIRTFIYFRQRETIDQCKYYLALLSTYALLNAMVSGDLVSPKIMYMCLLFMFLSLPPKILIVNKD